MANLEGFINYARIMPDDEETTAALCFESACAHAKDAAGIPQEVIDSGNDPKLDMYIYALALFNYDNRGFTPMSQSWSTNEFMNKQMIKMRNELMYKYRKTGDEDG